MYDYVRTQRVAPQMINAVIKVEKLKADDRFFNETGIEEEDVEPSVKRLNLEEDEEYKALVADFQKKSEEFLTAKKDETAVFMQKAQEMRAKVEAERAKQAVDKPSTAEVAELPAAEEGATVADVTEDIKKDWR